MIQRSKILWTTVSLVVLLIFLGAVYLVGEWVSSLPFRKTNDSLHKQASPVTLDLLIPAGVYIDEEMTVGQVAHRRFKKPGDRLTLFLGKISESIPVKYRLAGTTALYLFWTFLFLVFFRIFSWMRYTYALGVSFLGGAALYFFVPDLIIGRIDDTIFLAWSLTFFLTVRSILKRKKS